MLSLYQRQRSSIPQPLWAEQCSISKRSCEGCGTLRVHEFEESIYREMRYKIIEFQTLTGDNSSKVNPKLTALNIELAQVEMTNCGALAFIRHCEHVYLKFYGVNATSKNRHCEERID